MFDSERGGTGRYRERRKRTKTAALAPLLNGTRSIELQHDRARRTREGVVSGAQKQVRVWKAEADGAFSSMCPPPLQYSELACREMGAGRRVRKPTPVAYELRRAYRYWLVFHEDGYRENSSGSLHASRYYVSHILTLLTTSH